MSKTIQVVLWVMVAFAAFAVWAVYRKQSPEEIALGKDRGAIELCWKEQQRKSLDPATARFVASTCERMESEFRIKYKVNP